MNQSSAPGTFLNALPTQPIQAIGRIGRRTPGEPPAAPAEGCKKENRIERTPPAGTSVLCGARDIATLR